MIKRNYYKVVRVFPDPSSYFYIKNESMSEGLINFGYDFLDRINLESSFDKVNWTRLTGYPQFKVPADSYVYFRNTSGIFGNGESNGICLYYMNVSIGGDIRTILNYTDVDSVTVIPAWGFKSIFYMDGNYKITDISNLSFRGITSIEDHGLDMFVSDNYTGTKGVDLRDVTTLGEGAIRYMYANAYNLTEVYAPNVSTWDTSKTDCWLSGVASTGVVYKPSTLDIPTDTPLGIPSGWSTQDYPTI